MTQKHKESGAMKLRLLSPEQLLYEGEVESLIVKTQDEICKRILRSAKGTEWRKMPPGRDAKVGAMPP